MCIRDSLQVDDAEPLDVQSAPPRAAGHREDVAGAEVGRQLLPVDGTGEADGVGDVALGGELAQVLGVGSAADYEQHRVRHGRQDPWHGLDQGVLPLARHEPRDAHHDRPVGEAEPGPDLVAAGPRVEGLLVHARRQLHHAGRRLVRQGGGDAGARVLPQIGDRVGALADPAQQLPRGGQLGPARLVPVGRGHQPPRARPAQRGGHQTQGRGRPEPHRRTAVFPQQLRRAPGHPRRGQQHRRAVAHDGEGLFGVEPGGGLVALPGPLPGGGVDDDARRVQAQRHVVQEGLDATGAGREVVRDDQGLVHRRRQYRVRSGLNRATSRHVAARERSGAA